MNKLVLHVQYDPTETVEGALRMIGHFLDIAAAEDYSVVLVATGAAVRQFMNGAPLVEEIIKTAQKPHVKIKLCRNALKQNQMDEKDVCRCCDIVPAGVYELVRLQNAGYAYVKA